MKPRNKATCTSYHGFYKRCCCLIITSVSFFPLLSLAQPATKSSQEIAQQLGWVSVPITQNVCEGYYQEPYLNFIKQHRLQPDEIKITADRSSLFQRGKSILSGHVIIDREKNRVTAKRAEFQRDPKTGEITVVDFYNNVVFREQGKMVLGDRATFYNADKTGWIDNAWYRLALSEERQITDDVARFEGLNAWGHAERIRKVSADKWQLHNADVTTCSPLNRQWFIKAKRVDLNKTTGRGSVRQGTFYLGRVPIFYMPYYQFPIDDRRESGFLFPSFSVSERSGFMLAVPYYWNMAPNYDLTLTPALYTERGAELSTDFRYLSATGTGDIRLVGLPSDSEFPKLQQELAQEYPDNARRLDRLMGFNNDRWFARVRDTHQWDPHWSTELDWSDVSDDYYFQDFDTGLYNRTQTQLNRLARVDYRSDHWQAHALIQDFKTLHPINQSIINEPYQQLPQVGGAYYYTDTRGITYQGTVDATYFDQRRQPDTGIENVIGGRTHFHPTLTYNWDSSAGYIKPQAQLHLATYDLSRQSPNQSSHITRVIPMLSVDSGLYFDREWQFGERRYQQTLEPRLFYLNVPFREQSEVPVFDSAVQYFGFDQLFRTNRFSGEDRIGDANQLSMALTSRLIDEKDGTEKARLSVGQIWYFRDRLVSLCTTSGCQDSATAVGATAEITRFSPFVGAANYHLNPAWQVTASVAFDHEKDEVTNTDLNFHYQKDNNHIIDVSYGFTRNGEIIAEDTRNLQQGRIAFYWPIKQQWHTIGYLAYNFTLQRPQQYFYGLEYNSCCWAIRVVGERAYQALTQQGDPDYDDNVYVQILLKGLGNVGRNKTGQLLRQDIPGYEDYFERG